MFIEALFTIAKLWKQSRCPTTDEWIKKMWYLYTMEFYTAMKRQVFLQETSRVGEFGSQLAPLQTNPDLHGRGALALWKDSHLISGGELFVEIGKDHVGKAGLYFAILMNKSSRIKIY
jgi:hypothetical protein